MNSLSKGLFVFKNGLNDELGSGKGKWSKIAPTAFDFGDSARHWNAEFDYTWQTIQSKVDAFRVANNDIGLTKLLDFVDKSYSVDENDPMTDVSGSVYLPVASLLTGINKPDHHQYFKNLCDKLVRRNGTHTVVLPARDCPNVKSTIELLVSCALSKGQKHNYRDDEEPSGDNRSFLGDDKNDEEEDGEEQDMETEGDEPPIKLRRSQYTLNVLKSWYSERYSDCDSGKPKICVIIPNFEEFKPAVIVDLIRILSNHCHELPFVLILGVATTTASIFHTLSFTETTRIKLHAFSAASPVGDLNRILEDIILSPHSAFHVSGKIFTYFTNVFICYDLTANEFLRALRFCMLAHYSQGAAYAVCAPTCPRSMKTIEKMSDGTSSAHLSHKQIEQIRHLPSFRPLVEAMTNPNDVIAMLTDDEYFMNALGPVVRNVYSYFIKFHCYMRVLMVLVKDLPHAPLGKHLHDIYPYCIGGNQCVVDTEEFQKCWQYLALMSKQEIINLVEKCCHMMHNYSENYCSTADPQVDRYVAEDARKCIEQTINDLTSIIENMTNVEPTDSQSNQDTSTPQDSRQSLSRQEFKQKMLEKAQQMRLERNHDLKIVLDYLRDSVFGKYLLPSCNGPPLIELFVFSDHQSVKSLLKGAPRGAIHTALTNPQFYLQCNCCVVDDSSALIATMTDISIAYKLLLECGQHVNIFDWLTAFQTIVDPDSCDGDEIPPVIQARFTRARAELQFLGFIKSSKRKTDHVTRTTW